MYQNKQIERKKILNKNMLVTIRNWIRIKLHLTEYSFNVSYSLEVSLQF